MAADRRHFYRHPIHLPIQVKRMEATAAPSRSLDLSMGGLSFTWDQELPTGTPIQITIPVKKKRFQISARVAYCRKDGNSGNFCAGAVFENPDDAFRAKLAEEILEVELYRHRLSRETGRPVSEEEAARQWIEKFAEKFPLA